MTGQPIDDALLERLLAFDRPPQMSAGFAEQVMGEAQRSDRARLPITGATRGGVRRWTRRGIVTGVVAINLVLASAVAAAIGGGAISVAKITAVAHQIVAHFHRPHHRAEPIHHSLPTAKRSMPRAAHALAAAMPQVVRPITSPALMRPRLGQHPGMQGPRARTWRHAIARAHPMRHRPRLGQRGHLPGKRFLPASPRQGAGQGMHNRGWRAGQGFAPWRSGQADRGWRAPYRAGERMWPGQRRFGPGWRRGGGGRFGRRRF